MFSTPFSFSLLCFLLGVLDAATCPSVCDATGESLRAVYAVEVACCLQVLRSSVCDARRTFNDTTESI